jgi:AcrR family transcriptional regulator
MRSATPKKPSLVVPPPSREEVILDAAAALFRKQGFAGTGLRDIAAKAGMLLGSLQYRFPTKESLLVALMERAIERVMLAVRTAAEGVGDPLDRLRLGLGRITAVALASVAASRVSFSCAGLQATRGIAFTRALSSAGIALSRAGDRGDVAVGRGCMQLHQRARSPSSPTSASSSRTLASVRSTRSTLG